MTERLANPFQFSMSSGATLTSGRCSLERKSLSKYTTHLPSRPRLSSLTDVWSVGIRTVSGSVPFIT